MSSTMNTEFRRLMAEATRLTRLGRLQSAADAIGAALGRGAPRAAAAPHGDVIDVEAVEVAPPPSRPAAAGERFIAGSHAEAGSARDYKLYVPPQAGERPLPLIVMLHGCTQDADDFAAGTRMNDAARERGCFVLYPVQSERANPQRCWNWFKHNHQQRGRGEAALLAGMTRQVMALHAVEPRRVCVAGLSAGGAMAAVLGQAYPELYAAVGVHSGLPAGAAADLPSALQAMNGGPQRPTTALPQPTIVFHGDRDTTVHPHNGEALFGAGHAATAERARSANGRDYTRRVVRDADGRIVAEHWLVHGAGHAWSGGGPGGSYTDARGPDATREMLRFMLDQGRDPSR
jgi:poly(hydroxyalkanoate) depolymerase family esterase